jgi:hypothetical protein
VGASNCTSCTAGKYGYLTPEITSGPRGLIGIARSTLEAWTVAGICEWIWARARRMIHATQRAAMPGCHVRTPSFHCSSQLHKILRHRSAMKTCAIGRHSSRLCWMTLLLSLCSVTPFPPSLKVPIAPPPPGSFFPRCLEGGWVIVCMILKVEDLYLMCLLRRI